MMRSDTPSLSNNFLTLDYLQLNKDEVFIDFGCGMGRMICVVSTWEVKKVIGLELDPTLVERARKNIRSSKGGKTPIELVHGDAMDYDLSEGTVYYFYNPLGE